MKIILYGQERCSLSFFAEKHGLTMEVHERPPNLVAKGLPKYYAKFSGAEIRDCGCLISAYGDGVSPDEAIADYMTRITDRTLVFDPYDKERRQEIKVPILVS